MYTSMQVGLARSLRPFVTRAQHTQDLLQQHRVQLEGIFQGIPKHLDTSSVPNDLHTSLNNIIAHALKCEAKRIEREQVVCVCVFV